MIKHRTPEWYQARIGKFTASNFANLMAKPADRVSLWSKSAMNCIENAAIEIFLNKCQDSGRPDSDATSWGMRHEKEAIEAFAQLTGFETRETGFVLHPTLKDVGTTPDAIVIENRHAENLILAQIKCPYNQQYHLDYLQKIKCGASLQKSKSMYYWQMQGEMWVTGAIYSYFVSFDPRIVGNQRLHFAKIEKNNETIENLRTTISKAVILRDEIVEQYQTGKKKIPILIDRGTFKNFYI